MLQISRTLIHLLQIGYDTTAINSQLIILSRGVENLLSYYGNNQNYYFQLYISQAL